ncbi:MAG: 5'-nucleotidase C-terminal domain-containing protein [Planctomycetota bacterium]|jgi:2',3'-cyclic-nucleotide 2'-phosphodiesterase (5'-nucleotidase family)|nr:5'-nucleotidase C-terminal domain-containing protein [Planctomycetota bacterium]
MKKTYLLFALALFLGGTSAVFTADADLVIYHTNDVHGYAFHETGGDGVPTRWGYDYYKGAVNADATPAKMLLDAGDIIQGQAFAAAGDGAYVARLVALCGYDALAAGNHEFDYGWRRLVELRDRERLNFIAANIKFAGGRLLFPPYFVRDFGAFKVGVFGLTTPATVNNTAPRHVAELSFGDAAAIVQIATAAVKHLREVENVAVVMALTHLGSESYCEPSSLTIAREVPGIDVIIDGHSHSAGGVKINHTLVVSAGAYGVYLGKVAGRRTAAGWEWSAKLLPAAVSTTITPDPQLTAASVEAQAQLAAAMNEVVAQIPVDLDGSRDATRRGNSAFGRVVGAAMLATSGAEIALFNGGGLRSSLKKGDLTRGALTTAMPYQNRIVVVEITGATLTEALNHGLGLPGSGAFPQFYGMTVTAKKVERKMPDGAPLVGALTVETVVVNGKPLDPLATYRVAINDFMAAGGDGYALFKDCAGIDGGPVDAALIDYLRRASAPAIENAVATETLKIKQEE